MKIELNKNFSLIKESYLFSEIAKKVRDFSAAEPDKKIIKMGIGDVTLPLSSVVVDAFSSAAKEMGVKETFRGYPPEYGYDFLREAVKRKYAGYGVDISIDEIFISDGAKSDIGNIVDVFGNVNALIPDPVYPVYLDSNVMSGNSITFIRGSAENGFLPEPTGIEKKPYVIYLCSPNNPTGAVYDRAGLKKWVDFALDTGSLIVFDSAYEMFVSDDSPRSIFEIDGAKDCAIEICSLSKTAGFTGTRCGWTIIPKDIGKGDTKLIKLWKRRQATKFNGVSYPVQRAAEAALSDEGLAACKKQIDYYKKNAALLSSVLSDKGIFHTGGKNSPYVWFKCPFGLKSWEFFDFLLNKANVVGTPGSGFGEMGEGYFRLTGFSSRENTAEAAERFNKIL